MFIKPKDGLRVLNPETMRPLPEAGLEVSDTDPYWNRRERQGDVEIFEPPAGLSKQVQG